MQMRSWSQGVTAKILGVALLSLLMLIPLGQVQDLVAERQSLERDARTRIGERWGEAQIIGGPVLVVPVRYQVQQDKSWVTVERERFLLPESLHVKGSLSTDTRSYGIYSTPIYTAALAFSGQFERKALAAIAADKGEPVWAKAVLRVPISDVGGIRRLSPLKIEAAELAFGPGSVGFAGLASPEVAWPLDPDALASASFSFSMDLAGTQTITFLPLARQTEVELSGNWADPSYSGAFLPANHSAAGSVFTAQWQALDLNRNYGQAGALDALDAQAVYQSGFGLELFQPVGTYQRNERAGKYGILFIGLTFVALFLFEAMGRWRVHVVQYLLIGLALSTFYVVLLALSEQIGFGWAYLLASAALVIMTGTYAAAAARLRSAGFMLGGMLGLLYSLLYGLLISEQYSLLIGSLALLAAIASLMYLTRRIDWHALGAVADVPTGRMPG